MRWKLANGNVIASSKQPIQWRDFDRIEITDDYEDSYLSNYGTFEDVGGPPQTSDVEFTVRFYNPSTHTIRKSYSSGEDKFSITIGTETLGHTGGGYSSKHPLIHREFNILLEELDYGDSCTYYTYPPLTHIDSSYSHTVNPFQKNWYSNEHNIPEDRSLEPYENYEPDTFTYEYEAQFREGMTGGGSQKYHLKGHRVLHRVRHAITYKVR